MENNNLNLKFDKKLNKFALQFENDTLELEISNINAKNLISDLENVCIFDIQGNQNLAIYEEQDKINISFSQNDFKIISLNLKFVNAIDITNNLNYAAIYLKNEKVIKLQTIDCEITSNSNCILTIICKNQSSKIEIFENSSFSALTAAVAPDPDPDPPVSILSLTDTFVLSGSRGPEFSLGIFDEYTDGVHYRPRPIRLGVPVISTVPVYGENLTEEELTYFNNGEGPSFKKLYFRVVCNQELPESSVKLLIYLPNGTDTVTDPDYVDLVKISDAGQNSVYHGEYVFYVEDTVYSVDGFAYFSVYTDIIQQVSLTLQIDELPTTVDEFAAPATEIELF